MALTCSVNVDNDLSEFCLLKCCSQEAQVIPNVFDFAPFHWFNNVGLA